MALLTKHLRRLVTIIWGDWQTNDLWQRILKDAIACVIATIIAILPQLGSRSTFLIPMVVVFAHPGQRMGIMIESLMMILMGGILGLSWSIFGLYLGSLVASHNQSAAYAIRAVFLLFSTIFHGFVRSSSPRLFLFALFTLIPAVSVLGVPTLASPAIYENIYVPILIGGGVLVFVNLSIFPELSSSYLGTSTINALSEMVDTLDRATYWFITPGGDYVESRHQGSDLNTRTITTTSSYQTQVKQNKAIQGWHRFFSAFPNPFQSARGIATESRTPLHLTTLASLTEGKTNIRSQLAICKSAQSEVNFELSISPLAPSGMKPISTHHMSSLAQSVITLIGACENKFIVIGDNGLDAVESESSDSGHLPVYAEEEPNEAEPTTISAVLELNMQPNPGTTSKGKGPTETRNRVDFVKLNRQIEMSSGKLLESVLLRIQEPVQEFQASVKEAVTLLISCLAYCYDVPKLPSGAPTPRGIPLAEIDLRIDAFTDALALFDRESTEQLKQIVMHETGQALDFMPRMETFLISSFILAFRQSSMHILKMLRHARRLVEKRQRRNGWPRIWIPQYTNLRKWLLTGGEYDGNALPEGARGAARRGELAGNTSSSSDSSSKDLGEDEKPDERPDEEEGGIVDTGQNQKVTNEKQTKPPVKQKAKSNHKPEGWLLKLRGALADALEWAQHSDDLAYALKLSMAVFLVSWPAFVPSWSGWYAQVRGTWAPTQLILVFEVAIGTSSFSFFIRLFGVILGCLAGFVSYLIAGGSRPIIVLVLAFTILLAAYIHIATKYVKVGAVSIVSMTVVALATVNSSEAAVKVFYKRLVAFLVGGLVAMVIEVFVAPVRARDRLVESLSASVRHIQNMQAAMAVGIDGPEMPDFRSPKLNRRFKRSREKAQASLSAAETFLPFCLTEPRLKGSFKKLEPIYREIVYVLHQIIDRMDNVVQLRMIYGSSILEDLNPQVYTYRRSVAASSTLMLFSVNEALTTWLPLPQFIPSARLAQLRLINRVREIITSQMSVATTPVVELTEELVNEKMARLITKHNFLSWNASTAGQMEIVEYLEELIELAKLLVGVNAFRSGLLEKPNYKHYVQKMDSHRLSIDRVHTTRTEASLTRRSSVAVQEEASEIQDPVLRRAVTAAARVEKMKQKFLRPPRETGTTRKANRSESEGEVDREEVPVSLQRVGTRLWQGNEAARRRSRTVSAARP